MSGVVLNEVKRGFYLDSVALMRLSAEIEARPGVHQAVLMIGTEPNKAIMTEAGLLDDAGRAAGVNDLVIALRANDETEGRRSIEAALESLARRKHSATPGQAARPATLAGAAAQLDGANLALISTPGIFAAREARRALALGLNVMIFSDNVAVEDELALKAQARERGLLVMGPDCGTAFIGGVPLAFANVVPRGSVGVVAASGTGLQEVAVQLARAGAGLSHGIGVGGRDLSDAIGGISALAAIDLLEADAGTDRLILVSKPPGERTARAVYERLAACAKPAVACLLGRDGDALPGGTVGAATLKAAVELSLGTSLPDAGFEPELLAERMSADLSPVRRRVRGLYTGGTLCAEAQVVLGEAGLALGSDEHVMIDLGADEYTLGRPHPMVEPAVRAAPLAEALADPDTAVVLVDVVLGFGAHEDPARPVAEALAAVGDDRPAVVAYVCGTRGDPQDFDAQARMLQAAGAVVAPSNADAACLAAEIATGLAKRQIS